jgi:CDP-glucose 4,6-dehydratase
MFRNAFHKKRVWLSGHTGFKGAWLAEWLLQLGAEVYGFALPPDTQPSLFERLNLAHRIHHGLGDLRDRDAVRDSLLNVQPDFVLHLAAQPLVRKSYAYPVETYQTNVLGTIHVLESLRSLQSACTAILVTTDKCYENREHGLPYNEEDHLGGRDPYSSSKAMAELAIAAYRQSFFGHQDSQIRIASARAGNVIGGGDWAEDRIVPDCIRALRLGQPISVRNPTATRPWQHVLEPLSGYLWLAASLATSPKTPRAINFGPNPEANRSVGNLVAETLKHWPGSWQDASQSNAPHEAKLLSLSIEKARHLLRWAPVWNFEPTIEKTISWYHRFEADPASAHQLTVSQIQGYLADAMALNLPWTK